MLGLEGNSESIGKTAGKDEKAGKATLVSLMGIDRARKMADQLIGSSIERLSHFGDEADRLRSLAAFVLHRAH